MKLKGSDDCSKGRADDRGEWRWWGEERSVARARRLERDLERTWKSTASPDCVGLALGIASKYSSSETVGGWT